MKQSWTLTVTEDADTGDYLLTFPPDLLAAAGWQEGDQIEWIELGDAGWQLKKKVDE